jgi:hypothetical protein
MTLLLVHLANVAFLVLMATTDISGANWYPLPLGGLVGLKVYAVVPLNSVGRGRRVMPGRSTETPPLLTAAWLRDHHQHLTELQLGGEFCVYCGRESRTMVPVGFLGARQLWACLPPCAASRRDESNGA